MYIYIILSTAFLPTLVISHPLLWGMQRTLSTFLVGGQLAILTSFWEESSFKQVGSQQVQTSSSSIPGHFMLVNHSHKHPPNPQFYSWYKPFPSGWFMALFYPHYWEYNSILSLYYSLYRYHYIIIISLSLLYHCH